MRIFMVRDDDDDEEAEPCKVNFVDENDVLVGYSLVKSCCEDASYYFEDAERQRLAETPVLDGAVFDRGFCEETQLPPDAGGYRQYGARRVRFKIEGDNFEGFLVLENDHNGYYGHGFDMAVGSETLWEGYL
jgi:hypothetical protein